MVPSRPINGKSKVFGIFGCPIDHTLSPLMHNAAFEALDLPYCYLPFEVHPEGLKEAVEAIIPLGIRGVNVTIPHKEAVIPLLDWVDEEAQKIGAVNTIENSSNRLIGHNTDGKGFLQSLLEAGVEPSGRRVILLGAGGAARAVAVQLLERDVSEITIMTRTLKRGRDLADWLTILSPNLNISVRGMNIEKRSMLFDDPATLLINTTPLGMKRTDPLPFPPEYLHPLWVVADLIYRPYETPLLSVAKNIGAKVVPGLGMLLHQGALAFEIWTKEPAPLQIMKEALQRELISE